MAGFFSTLKYKLFGKKIKIEMEELVEWLLDELFTIAFGDFMNQVNDIALKAEIQLNEDDLSTIRGAVIITTFWLCIHALGNNDSKFIKEFVSAFSNRMEKKSNIKRKDLNESLTAHFTKYNSALKEWEKNPENGLAFGFVILCGIFNSGLPDKRLIDPLLSAQITGFVTIEMKRICSYKEMIDKMYEY